MALFYLHHRHDPAECTAAFAAWRGFDSPLRHRPVAGTCLTGGHCLLWLIEAGDGEEAAANLPAFVAARTEVIEVREIDVP